MAFPTTGVLDNFNRSETPISDGGKWTLPWFSTDPATGLNCDGAVALQGVTAYRSAYRSNVTYGPDSEVFISVPTLPAAADDIFVGLRIQSPNTVSMDCYMAEWFSLSGTDRIDIYRVDNEAFTLLGASVSLEMAAGDSLGLEAIGSTIKCYTKASGGSWTEQASRTDSTYATAGNIGFGGLDTVYRMDDFGGGTVAGGGFPFRSCHPMMPLLAM